MTTTHAIRPANTQRFTIDGSAALEARLREICARVRTGMRACLPAAKLETVLLAGGYGRGEGGVLVTSEGDLPYNDLEFYIGLRGSPWWNEKRLGPALHEMAETLTHFAGIEVEFKIISFTRLERQPVTMFSYDLAMGHRRLLSDEGRFANLTRHRDASQIPTVEATRLLMNRGTGLLLARERLAAQNFSDADADFVGRNLAKVQLALGDAVLTTLRQYHWSCRERQQRLARWRETELPDWFPAVRTHHATGVKFKLHPTQASAAQRDQLKAQLETLLPLAAAVWLWLESLRLQRPFDSIADYALSDVDKAPPSPAWRNRLLHVRAFGPASLWMPRTHRYPRERLFNALALLLWEPDGVQSGALLARCQQDLNTKAKSFPKLLTAYDALWRRFR